VIFEKNTRNCHHYSHATQDVDNLAKTKAPGKDKMWKKFHYHTILEHFNYAMFRFIF